MSDNAHGNHGIARHLANILSRDLSFVLTRRYRRSFTKIAIQSSCPDVSIRFHPDSSGLGVRRVFPSLAALVDVILFAFWLPFGLRSLKACDTTRIFILAGADAWFLFNVWLLQCSKFPVDLYLVDDIEESTKYGHNRTLQTFVKPLLASVLRRSARVYAISVGFAEYLENRFRCKAEWLPVPSSVAPPDRNSYNICRSDQRHITFIGGLNHLYNDALQDLYEEIDRFNASPDAPYRLIMEIITYGNLDNFRGTLPNQDWFVGFCRLPDQERFARLANSYACFLPYSFKANERVMVSTSFSCKILEYFAAGRPILVYGPEYASIPRYFKDEGLPLCATSKVELTSALKSIQCADSPELLEQYHSVWAKYHSPTAVRRRILGWKEGAT